MGMTRRAEKTVIIASMRPIIRTPPSGRFGLNMKLRVFPDGCPVRSLHAVLAFRIDIDVASIAPCMGRIDPDIRVVFRFAMKLVLIVQLLADGVEVRVVDFNHRSCGNMVVGHKSPPYDIGIDADVEAFGVVVAFIVVGKIHNIPD
jgi:hypothetical protein